MLIEIRWKGPKLMAQIILLEMGEEQFGLKFHGTNYDHGLVEAIGCEVPNWSECQTNFELYLLPRMRDLGARDAEIYIEGRTMGAWLAYLEGKYMLLRWDVRQAVADLKATRRFFRNKVMEGVSTRLKVALDHYCAGAPSED